MIAEPDVPEVIPKPDKYEFKPITGNEIYFKDFNFKLAIIQDGGNDIYMNMIPFRSGETDDFNIQHFDHVDQFTILKKITLFYDKQLNEITEQMKKKGIEVEPL